MSDAFLERCLLIDDSDTRLFISLLSPLLLKNRTRFLEKKNSTRVCARALGACAACMCVCSFFVSLCTDAGVHSCVCQPECHGVCAGMCVYVCVLHVCAWCMYVCVACMCVLHMCCSNDCMRVVVFGDRGVYAVLFVFREWVRCALCMTDCALTMVCVRDCVRMCVAVCKHDVPQFGCPFIAWVRA
eukprot:GDKI01024179.1.p2 GENE.GDKI01024179.1~~GDKI01024179.1.p2  ORF type:complete len:186 (-),score=49.67 GDKI01024179.1:331-888(-)